MADDPQQLLDAWVAAYAAREGRHPRRPEIFAHETAAKLFDVLRAREKAAAGPVAPGGCGHYLWRVRRYCRKRALENAEFCSEHIGESTAQEPEWRRFGTDSGQQRKAQAAPRRRRIAAQRRARGDEVDLEEGCRRRRMKHKSNPLAMPFLEPAGRAQDWSLVFDDAERPLFLDLGCAKGRFLQRLAAGEGGVLGPHNFLGVELFAPLVEEAVAWRDAFRPGPSNLHYLAGNAEALLRGLEHPLPNLRRVAIQFPDPWSVKYEKRRLVTPAFAQLLADLLPPGGTVYLASDVEDLATQIRARLLATGAFDIYNAVDGGVFEAPLVAEAQAAANGMGEARRREDAASKPQATENGEAPTTRGDVVPQKQAASNASPLPRDCSSDEVVALVPDLASEETLPKAGEAGQGTDEQPELPWMSGSYPYGVPTERDLVCELEWRRVWRCILRRR